jgi:hypothetical protein
MTPPFFQHVFYLLKIHEFSSSHARHFSRFDRGKRQIATRAICVRLNLRMRATATVSGGLKPALTCINGALENQTEVYREGRKKRKAPGGRT